MATTKQTSSHNSILVLISMALAANLALDAARALAALSRTRGDTSLDHISGRQAHRPKVAQSVPSPPSWATTPPSPPLGLDIRLARERQPERQQWPLRRFEIDPVCKLNTHPLELGTPGLFEPYGRAGASRALLAADPPSQYNSHRRPDNVETTNSELITAKHTNELLAPLSRFLLETFRLVALQRLPLVAQVQAIRLIRLEAPQSPIPAGQPFRLRCIYDTRGDKLQSLSWYKNGREFYRYQPYERNRHILSFEVAGVDVDLTKSRNNTVILTNTTLETSGRYKCEVTGASFQEVNMDVAINVIAATGSGIISAIRTTWMFQKTLFAVILSMVLVVRL